MAVADNISSDAPAAASSPPQSSVIHDSINPSYPIAPPSPSPPPQPHPLPNLAPTQPPHPAVVLSPKHRSSLLRKAARFRKPRLSNTSNHSRISPISAPNKHTDISATSSSPPSTTPPRQQKQQQQQNRLVRHYDDDDDDDDDRDDDSDSENENMTNTTRSPHPKIPLLHHKPRRPSIEAARQRAADAGQKLKGIDLASVLSRPREDRHTTVRYIAQIDVADHMLKRSKVGPNTHMYVTLEGTNLSVSKNKNASSARYHSNVRATFPSIDVKLRELKIYVPTSGKVKVLRLYMDTEECAAKWKEALENAVNSDITEYYTFGKTLGSGAYGEVVKAVNNISKEMRAIKIIKRGDNIKSKEHLDAEIQVMKSISHENIVQTYQIFDLRRTIYIVMEYVPCGDLFDFVAKHDCLTEKQGSQTMKSIFRAVEYLHSNAIVHRDLKPENILCVNDSWPLEIKVSDFGFAHFLDPLDDADDNMRTQVGTVYFMAPEIISNKGHGPAVDLWACGVILYTILTGRLPFPGRNTTEYLKSVVRGNILFPAVLWKDISEDAKSLVKGLLNLDPKKRLHIIGALQHRWIRWPDATYGSNEIRRDRSNLHSGRRRLFKARKAIIAVAMANKFKATVPHVVEDLGDKTKKVAGAIESGVKKTADGIATGVMHFGEEIAEGTKNIGENTKKVAASVADGTKKVAEGIGTGVKKTVDGVENGARKMGHGVKKTADGIESGLKKTADGIGQGVKATADGIGQGVMKTAEGAKKAADGLGQGVKKTADGLERGVKNTGHTIKRGVDRMRNDRSRDTEGSQSQMNTESQTSSTRRSAASGAFRRSSRHQAPSTSSACSGSERSDAIFGNGDIPKGKQNRNQHRRKHRRERIDEGGRDVGGGDSSADEYLSALEEHSETEEGWGAARGTDADELHYMGMDDEAAIPTSPSPLPSPEYTNDNSDGNNHDVLMKKGNMNGVGGAPIISSSTITTNSSFNHHQQFHNIPASPPPLIPPPSPPPLPPPWQQEQQIKPGAVITRKKLGGGGRPALAPLSGLTMGLSDESMAGSSAREYRGGGGSNGSGSGAGGASSGGAPPPLEGFDGLESPQIDLLRKATLLMTSNS